MPDIFSFDAASYIKFHLKVLPIQSSRIFAAASCFSHTFCSAAWLRYRLMLSKFHEGAYVGKMPVPAGDMRRWRDIDIWLYHFFDWLSGRLSSAPMKRYSLLAIFIWCEEADNIFALDTFLILYPFIFEMPLRSRAPPRSLRQHTSPPAFTPPLLMNIIAAFRASAHTLCPAEAHIFIWVTLLYHYSFIVSQFAWYHLAAILKQLKHLFNKYFHFAKLWAAFQDI